MDTVCAFHDIREKWEAAICERTGPQQKLNLFICGTSQPSEISKQKKINNWLLVTPSWYISPNHFHYWPIRCQSNNQLWAKPAWHFLPPILSSSLFPQPLCSLVSPSIFGPNFTTLELQFPAVSYHSLSALLPSPQLSNTLSINSFSQKTLHFLGVYTAGCYPFTIYFSA